MMKFNFLNGLYVTGFLVLISSSIFISAHPGHDVPKPSPGVELQPSQIQTTTASDSISGPPTSYEGCFKKVYAFGDSFTDTGNAQLLGGLKSFVGIMISKFFSPQQSGNLPGSRLSNGRLVIDFLCQSLGIPALPAYKDTTGNFSVGANFAIAGSSALAQNFYNAHKIAHALMFKAIPLTIQTQLDWFHNFMNEIECKGKSDFDCSASLNNSLFWVGEMGGNDYSRMLSSSFSIPMLTKMTIGHVHNLVKVLIGRGAKYIMVQGLPPVGCCPLSMALSRLGDRDRMGCAPIANGLIKAHNKLLQWKLAKLRMLFPHCTIAFVDTWNAYKTVVTNPKKFNFEEPFKACCGAGGGALNFDVDRLCGSEGTTASSLTVKDSANHPFSTLFGESIHQCKLEASALPSHYNSAPALYPCCIPWKRLMTLAKSKHMHKIIKQPLVKSHYKHRPNSEQLGIGDENI